MRGNLRVSAQHRDLFFVAEHHVYKYYGLRHVGNDVILMPSSNYEIKLV